MTNPKPQTSELSRHRARPGRDGQAELSKSAKPQRHSWGEPDRMVQKTERECAHNCGWIKVTLHPDGRDGREHYVEFWRDGEKFDGTHTPACEPVEVMA